MGRDWDGDKGGRAEWIAWLGTGTLNIEACRIGHAEPIQRTNRTSDKFCGVMNPGHLRQADELASADPAGRWPAHLSLDEAGAAALDEQSGITRSGGRAG